MVAHRDWYSRGYLPHCDQPGKIQSVTIRLSDAMPVARRAEWEELLKGKDGGRAPEAEQRRKIEAYLDAGYGACHLQNPVVAAMVEESMLLPGRGSVIFARRCFRCG
jgi:hypothetical protein